MIKRTVDKTELRQRAETALQARSTLAPVQLDALAPEVMRQALHELNVHQIELEMQNEELRESHAALDAARARYFDLYDLAPVGYCTVCEKGLILEANLTLSKLLGAGRRALVKRPFSRFILKEDADRFYQHHRSLISTGEPQDYELQLLTHAGSTFWAHLVTTAAHDAEGMLVVRIVLNDISERKKVEARLQQSEAFNLAVLDSISAEIAVLNHDGVIVAVNQAWRRFAQDNPCTGGSPARQINVGSDYLAVCRACDDCSPEGTLNAHDGIRAVLDGRLPRFSLDYPCHSPQQQRWFTMRVSPLGDGVVISHTDVSDLKRAGQYEQFHRRILERLAQDVPLTDLLEALVREVERLHPSMMCCIQQLDQEGMYLGKGVAPSLPEAYITALDGIEIGLGAGSCGLAAYSGERVIIENIATHPSWVPCKALAVEAGLGACWSQPIHSSSGKVLGTFSIYHRQACTPTDGDLDLIEQAASLASIAIDKRLAADLLRDDEERWKFALEGSDAGVWDWNIQTGEALYSKRWKEMIGFAEDEIGNGSDEWSSRVHPDDRPMVLAAIQALVNGEVPTVAIEFRLLCKDGRWLWMLGRGMVVSRSADGRALRLVGTNTDISARRQMEEEVRHLAFYDQLTDLPNRRLLIDRLAQSMAASARSACYGALMFLDLDNFKPLNDLHGHDAGDLLLIEAARRLKRCVREVDTVARFGGDELVVVIGELNVDQAESKTEAGLVAEKIRSALSEPYLLAIQHGAEAATVIEHRCTASIGVVLFFNHEASQNDILRWADTAMYQAKDAGRNLIRFYDADA